MIVQLNPKLYDQISYYNKAKLDMEEEKMTLISYSTKILEVDTSTHQIKWLCDKYALSNTTLRHIRDFLYQYKLMRNLTKKEIIRMMEESNVFRR